MNKELSNELLKMLCLLQQKENINKADMNEIEIEIENTKDKINELMN